MVTTCTAQWSLYVRHSGHYMYRTVVTICTAQWSLYVPPVQHSQFHVLPTQLYLCVLCGSQNEQPLFPYTTLTDCLYNRDGVCLLRGTDWVFMMEISLSVKCDQLQPCGVASCRCGYRKTVKRTRLWTDRPTVQQQFVTNPSRSKLLVILAGGSAKCLHNYSALTFCLLGCY